MSTSDSLLGVPGTQRIAEGERVVYTDDGAQAVVATYEPNHPTTGDPWYTLWLSGNSRKPCGSAWAWTLERMNPHARRVPLAPPASPDSGSPAARPGGEG